MRAGKLGDGVVGQLLHPPLQSVGAGHLVAGVVVELVGNLTRGGTRENPPAHLLELGLQAEELLPPPLVRLLEVDGRAEEVPRRQRVGVPSDGVLLLRVLAQLGAQERGEVGVRLIGHHRGSGQFVGEGAGALAAGGDRREVPRSPGGSGVGVALLGAPVDLADCRHPATANTFTQALDVPAERLRKCPHPRRHVGEVLVAFLGKEVEQQAHVLHGRGDDVERRVEVAGVVAVEVQLQPFREHVGGHPVALGVDWLLRCCRQRAADQGGLLLEPVG